MDHRWYGLQSSVNHPYGGTGSLIELRQELPNALKKIYRLQEIHLTTIYSAGIVQSCCRCDTRLTSE